MQKFRLFVIIVSVIGETSSEKKNIFENTKIFVRMNLTLEDYLLKYSINTEQTPSMRGTFTAFSPSLS